MGAMFRSGFVSITGRPNVGKSTFLNAVLGQKVSIVTPKPQTTRNRIIGIKTLKDAQIIFVDTPGIHRPRHRLGELMLKEAKTAVRDVDAVVLMVEPKPPSEEDSLVLRLLRNVNKPVFLLINKMDTVKKPVLLPLMDKWSGLYPFAEIIPVSALKGEGLELVVEKLKGLLPEGPAHYPEDLVTDRLERFLVAEIIREKAMMETEEEVPHSIAVEVVEWAERKGGSLFIGANIYVEKEGQKSIIIGHLGSRLKAIGSAARADIERLLGVKTYLELWVKLRPGWRTDRASLVALGIDEGLRRR